MKYYFILLIFNYSLSVAQDKIITKSLDNNMNYDKTLKIEGLKNDTLYYKASGVEGSIPLRDVVAIKENTTHRDAEYIYLKPSDERIYGIKNDAVFFKSDYKFNVKNRELSAACFLERFRVYDSIIPKSKHGNLYLRNNESGKKKRIHKNVKFVIILKDDILNRRFKGVLHYISKDSTQMVMKIRANGEKNMYSFKNNDIKMIGLEAPAVFIARHSLGIASFSSIFLVVITPLYYKSKWYKRYNFDKWHLAK